MYNRVILIGRLTKDVDLRQTQNGVAVASFTLAVDRKFKAAGAEKEADFVTIITWKQLAELCAKYLAKGKLAAIEGRLQIRSYEDQQGQKKTIAEVVADDVRFLSPKEQTKYEPDVHEPTFDTFDDEPF